MDEHEVIGNEHEVIRGEHEVIWNGREVIWNELLTELMQLAERRVPRGSE